MSVLKTHYANLLARRVVLIEYLKMKVDERDWHGVSDAANDLRELEVEIRHEKEARDRSREQVQGMDKGE